MTKSPDTRNMILRDVCGDAGPLSQGQNGVLKKYIERAENSTYSYLLQTTKTMRKKNSVVAETTIEKITPRAKQREIKRIKKLEDKTRKHSME